MTDPHTLRGNQMPTRKLMAYLSLEREKVE
jgi:hypothetical protein